MTQSSNTLNRKKPLTQAKSFDTHSIELYEPLSSKSSTLSSVSSATIVEQMKNDTSSNANIYEDMYFSNKPPMTAQSTKRHSNFVSNLIDKMFSRGRERPQHKMKKPIKSQKNDNNFGMPLILSSYGVDDDPHANTYIDFKENLDNTYESIHFNGGGDGDDDDKNEVNNCTSPILSIHPSVFGMEWKYVDGVRKIEYNSNTTQYLENKSKLMRQMSKTGASDDNNNNTIFLNNNLTNSRCYSNTTNLSWSTWSSADNIDNINEFDDSQLIIAEEIRRLSKGSIIDEQISQRNTLRTVSTNVCESFEELDGLKLLSTSNAEVLGVFIPAGRASSEHSSPSTTISFVSATKGNNHSEKIIKECANEEINSISKISDSSSINDITSEKCFLHTKQDANAKRARPKFAFLRKNVIRTCLSLKKKLCAVIA